MPVATVRLPARMATLLRCWSVPANFAALYRQDHGTFHLINGLRFFSFAWILAFHTVLVYALRTDKQQFFTLAEQAPLSLWWVWNADKAVDLFFVVSGFLIGLILLREIHKTGDIDLPRFYFRRYLRLTPVYALIALLYWWGAGSNADMLLANLLYINNFLPVDDMAMRWTWTLAVEEQFYLALPLALLWLGRAPLRHFWRWTTGLLLLSFAIRALVIFWFPELRQHSMPDLLAAPGISDIYYEKLYDNLFTRYGPFVLGVMTAWLYLHRRPALADWFRQRNGLLHTIDAASLLLFLWLLFYPVNQAVHGEPGGFLQAYLVSHHNLFALAVSWFMLRTFLNLHRPSLLTRFLSWRGWQPFSQLTYSMYLTHLMIIGLALANVQAQLQALTSLHAGALVACTLVLGFALSLLLSVLVGILCWLLVEKPFLNLRDWLSEPGAATRASPSPA